MRVLTRLPWAGQPILYQISQMNARNAAILTSRFSSSVANQAKAAASQKVDQAKGVAGEKLDQAKGVAGARLDQAKGIAADKLDQVKSAAQQATDSVQQSVSQNIPSVPSPSDAQARAEAIKLLDRIPSFKHISNTQAVTLLTAFCAYLISKEVYVFNDETIVLVAFTICATAMAKLLRAPIAGIADGRIKDVVSTINDARQQHRQEFEGRKGQLSELAQIESATKEMFKMARETIEMESKAFELKQRAALMSEVKSYLDGWVKHEANVRDRQQRMVAQQVIDKLNASIKDPSVQNQILSQCFNDLASVRAQK